MIENRGNLMLELNDFSKKIGLNSGFRGVYAFIDGVFNNVQFDTEGMVGIKI